MNWLDAIRLSWLREMLDTINTFLGDMFWDVATSPPVLIAIGLLAVAAFVVAHVPWWIERFFPVVVPYTRTAMAVQYLAAAALCFLIGFGVADDRADLARLKNDLEYSEFMLDQQRQVAEEADRLKREADAEAAAAKDKLDAYHAKFGPNPGVSCSKPAGYDDWLRTLQRRGRHALARADQPQRGLVARVRALGGKRQ
jgi:hypothetical protein